MTRQVLERSGRLTLRRALQTLPRVIRAGRSASIVAVGTIVALSGSLFLAFVFWLISNSDMELVTALTTLARHASPSETAAFIDTVRTNLKSLLIAIVVVSLYFGALAGWVQCARSDDAQRKTSGHSNDGDRNPDIGVAP